MKREMCLPCVVAALIHFQPVSWSRQILWWTLFAISYFKWVFSTESKCIWRTWCLPISQWTPPNLEDSRCFSAQRFCYSLPYLFFSLKRLLLFSLSPVHSNTSEQIATSHIFKFKFFLPLFLQEVVLENSVPWLSLVPAVVFPLSGAPCSPDISYSPSTGPKSSLLLGFPSSSTNAFTAGSQFLTRVWGSVLLLRLIRCNHRGL